MSHSRKLGIELKWHRSLWWGHRGSRHMLICVCGFEDLVGLLLLTQVVNPAVSPELSRLCDFFAVVWREKVNHLTDSGSHQPWVSQFWCCWKPWDVSVHCGAVFGLSILGDKVSRKVAQWRMRAGLHCWPPSPAVYKCSQEDLLALEKRKLEPCIKVWKSIEVHVNWGLPAWYLGSNCDWK